MEIEYTSESPAKEYGKAIRKAKTREALIENLLPFKRVADDAIACAKKMTDADFKDFKRDLPKAAKITDEKWIETFDTRFGDIAMPYKLLISELTAAQFHCPWGCAFIRCEEIGFKRK